MFGNCARMSAHRATHSLSSPSSSTSDAPPPNGRLPIAESSRPFIAHSRSWEGARACTTGAEFPRNSGLNNELISELGYSQHVTVVSLAVTSAELSQNSSTPRPLIIHGAVSTSITPTTRPTYSHRRFYRTSGVNNANFQESHKFIASIHSTHSA